MLNTMASGGLTFVTPPHVKESSPGFVIDSGYKSSKSQSNHTSDPNRDPKSRSNDFEKMKTSIDEWSTETHNKRCFSVSFGKPNDSQTIRKRSETNYRKRRYSFGTNSDQKFVNQKRRKDRIILPTKFLLGGNITDPLNLSSLANGANQVTPQSSPLPTPRHKIQVEVLIPANINDPLNLNSNEDIDESSLISPKMKTKARKRKRKRTDSETTVDTELETSVCTNNSDTNTEPKKCENAGKPQKLRFNDSLKTTDKIVSPVIPQGMGPKYRRFGDNSKPIPESETLAPNSEAKVKHKKYNKRKLKSKETHFRPKDDSFRYGNYNRYYGYRNSNQKDCRLDSMKRDWFEDKDVLDIGCNVGHMTLAIAKNFEPKKIIGLDIDSSLIRMANKNVRHYITSSVLQTQDFPISLPLFHGPLASTVSVGSNVDKSSCFPKNVCFIAGNYIAESEDSSSVQKQQFDAILCLSLTKWVHLNWGDSGLKTLFKRIFSQLRPNGKLILEAQPWCSYKKKKKINETTFHNFNAIKFRPEQFNEYLLSREVGFSQSELIGTPTNPSKGFRRPMYLFTKSGVSLEKE